MEARASEASSAHGWIQHGRSDGHRDRRGLRPARLGQDAGTRDFGNGELEPPRAGGHRGRQPRQCHAGQPCLLGSGSRVDDLETAVNCTSGNNAPCTSTQIAAYDLQQWSASLTTLLPSPSATISCSAFTANAPVTCTIQISWVENTVAVNTQGSNTAAMAAPSYTLFVQP